MKGTATESSRILGAGSYRSAGLEALFFVASVSGFLVLLVWCYFQGLSGPFLMDDFHNLSGLSHVQESMSWSNVRDWLLTGASGPTGRPLSLLTFLVNAHAWPYDAWSFKYTNLLLHGINSLLVFWLSLLLLRRVHGDSARVLLLAMVASLLWAFSPYHVSTVLYVIQRMAILASLFVLGGLVLYVQGRVLLEKGRLAAGAALILGAYFSGAGLGVLSKENAALFVLMVPVVEWVFFAKNKGAGLSVPVRRALLTVLIAPAVIFLAGMATQVPSFIEGFEHNRDFTLGERLLSQGRALGYYLWRYLLPGGDYLGLYGGDSFQKSTGLFEPFSTFVWMCVHLFLIYLAVRLRKMFPLFSFGVLFFYVAHSLESSIVPLELLFEHRNYLPSAFIWLGLASLVKGKKVLQFLLLVLLANVVLLKGEVSAWRDSGSLLRENSDLSIGSERTVQNAANWMLSHGNYDGAYFTLQDFIRHHKVTLNTSLMFAVSACMAGRSDADHMDTLMNAVESGSVSQLPERHLKQLTTLVARNRCGSFTITDLRLLLRKDMETHAVSPRKQQDYYASLAMLDLIEGDFEAFKQHGYQSMEAFPNRSVTLGFCRRLTHMDRNEGCRCFTRAKPALQGGMYKTLVRSLFGYEERVMAEIEQERNSVCSRPG